MANGHQKRRLPSITFFRPLLKIECKNLYGLKSTPEGMFTNSKGHPSEEKLPINVKRSRASLMADMIPQSDAKVILEGYPDPFYLI
jgi:hypothetical protein